MNGNAIRSSLATTTVLLTLAVVMMGANRGETAEQSLDAACESAVWPMIPAKCFGSYDDRDVDPDVVAVEAAQVIVAVEQRPQLSTLGASGKADLLQVPEIDNAQYRTVETRSDGVSILRRVKAE